MSKTTKRASNLRRLMVFAVVALISLALAVRYLFYNSNATDLQKILQNLPKEISQSINSANNIQSSDSDLVQHFESLAQEIRNQQEIQAKQFDKQRKILEKKIQDLKQTPPEATLRERIAFTFPYNSHAKFPAFIWQTWSDESPERVRDIKGMWESKNPGFAHEVLTHDVINALVHHYFSSIPEILETYETLPSIILKIDFFKYLILLVHGGVYADIDTFPVQPIPNWIPEELSPSDIGLIIGVEEDAQRADWRTKFIRRLQFGTWIIQAKPGHPILREIISQIIETTLQRKKDDQLNVNLRNDLNIMSWTGSGLWTDTIFTYFNDFMRSGVSEKVTWTLFHNLKHPKLLSDVLVFPKFSFNCPNEIANDDPYKKLYFITHLASQFWKNTPKVEQK
ncbi:hoc1p [Saccharomyces arboricola H-6]|uniref:Hoc1p n=1 Tax=Saccharomyces arboricola (strain H-6 / AS 2.3317 / CBS 10644) TaxID=1160507 RepID=J8PLU6_SACAR|nr:hoc1p [Saccharomyces arboricola H-6]